MDYGMSDFFRKSFEFQQTMAKNWMDSMPRLYGEKETDSREGASSFEAMYKGLYENWTKQFMDNPWMKVQPWSYNMFNSGNPVFDMFNKMMNSGKTLSDANAFWGKLDAHDVFKTRDEILKFLDANKETYEKLLQDFITPFVPETIRPMLASMSELVKKYEALGKDFVKPWMDLGPNSIEQVQKAMGGDINAYSDIYKTINTAYEESYGKLFNAAGLGVTREQHEEMMTQFDSFFKMMLAMTELMSLIGDVSRENMVTVIEQYQKLVSEGAQPRSMKDFYELWVKINEDAFVKVFATPQFSKIFCSFAQKSCEFKIHFEKVLEQMMSWVPVPKNSDMNSLYKTVYDLRKAEYKNTQELLAIREELAEVKSLLQEQAKQNRKGDK